MILCCILICLFFCISNLNPIVKREYVDVCQDDGYLQGLLLNISKLEGTVVVLQRMTPIFASLIVAVVLFLTWRQQEAVKNAAIIEIHSTFKQHEDRIVAMEATAKEKLQQIESHYNISESFKTTTKEVLVERIKDFQDIVDNL